MKSVVMGVDISMTHGAFVLLSQGELDSYWFVADRKSIVDKSHGLGQRYFPARIRDMVDRDMMRIVFWDVYLRKMFAKVDPGLYVGIEGYAYNMPMGSHQLGEIGGLVRLRVWESGAKMRLHDPSSLKIFTAHDGSASKPEVVRCAKKRWPESKEFAKYSEGKYTATEEDLCDALAIAKMTWTEVLLRNGAMRMKDLHPQEVRVFNRCTSRWPTSLLDRDWLQRSTVFEDSK